MSPVSFYLRQIWALENLKLDVCSHSISIGQYSLNAWFASLTIALMTGQEANLEIMLIAKFICSSYTQPQGKCRVSQGPMGGWFELEYLSSDHHKAATHC